MPTTRNSKGAAVRSRARNRDRAPDHHCFRATARVAESDIVITCTTARDYFITREMVRPGTFVAGVGADNENKQELDPALLAASKLVTDLTEQCAVIGDLHHALAAGTMTRSGVHAELGEIVAALKPGRTSEEETIIFDFKVAPPCRTSPRPPPCTAARSSAAGALPFVSMHDVQWRLRCVTSSRRYTAVPGLWHTCRSSSLKAITRTTTAGRCGA